MFDYLANGRMTSQWSGLLHLALWTGRCLLNLVFEHPVVYACSLVVLVLWYLNRRPYEIIKDLSDVGFEHLTEGKKGKAARRLVREALRRSVPSDDIPPVYPNGWIPILQSRQLAKGQVKPISAMGEELAVFRGQTGEVHVVDAFCPHLGAHLAVGGRVNGTCIVCPFHGWKFDGITGNCVNVPYSSKVPSFSKLKTWQSCEVNGLIFFWYHAEGEQPSWTVPAIPEVEAGTWTYRGRTVHMINCHIQEVPENGADVGHLGQLHNDSMFAGGQPWNVHHLWRAINSHTWDAQWSQGPEPHVVSIKIRHDVHIAGLRMGFLGFDLKISQVGPALVILRADSCWGQAVFIQSVTPIGPLRQRLVHTFYAVPKFPNFMAKIFLYGEAAMVERDITIWNSKRLLRKPILVAEDKFIPKYRRWYSQFYSEHSPTYKEIRRKALDW